MKVLDWKRLVVVTTHGSVPNSVGWRCPPTVFPAETCNRHVYIGLHGDFFEKYCAVSNDPVKKLLGNSRTKMFQGVDAYKFLVNFGAGLLGEKYQIDKEVSGQLRNAFNNFKEKQIILGYMEAILADITLLKTEILTPHYSRATDANAAINMASLSADSAALIICGPTALSVELISSLGHKRKNTPNMLTLTHPDNQMGMKDILHAIDGKKQGHQIVKAGITVIPFDEALSDGRQTPTNLFNAQAVFVCLPMNGSTIDQRIYSAWKERKQQNRDDGLLLHMKGTPELRGASSGPWLSMPPDMGFVPYSTLCAARDARRDALRKVIEATQSAVVTLGQARLMGDRVVAISSAANDNGSLNLKYTYARRPQCQSTNQGSNLQK